MLLNCLHLFKLPDNPGQPIPMSGVLNPKKCAIKDLTWFIFNSTSGGKMKFLTTKPNLDIEDMTGLRLVGLRPARSGSD